MAKWRVDVSWECEVEADDEGDALLQADGAFSFMREARAEEICEADKDRCENCESTEDLGVLNGDDVLLCKQCRASTTEQGL